MTWEEYEAMLNDLANPELDQETRTNHLLALKKDGSSIFTQNEQHVEKIAEQEERIKGLREDNMRLYLEVPTDRTKSEKEIKEEQAKEFEQTVTISDLERGRINNG